jgi:uncharacterized Zn-binding protein involved in type VI secretion
MPQAALAGKSLTDAGVKLGFAPDTAVFVNGSPIAVAGVAVDCHQHGNQTVCSVVQLGSPDVTAGGKMVVRVDDQALCGHKVIIGSFDVSVN